MGFLSSVGNFLGGLGNFFSGGGNNSQVVTTTTTQILNQMKPAVNAGSANVAQNPGGATAQLQAAPPALNLFQSPLQKVAPNPQTPAQTALGGFEPLQKAPQAAPLQSAPQQPNFIDRAANAVNDAVIKPALTTAGKFVNEGAAATAGLIGGGQALLKKFQGNQQGYQDTLNSTHNAINDLLTHGVGDVGAFQTPEQASGNDFGKDIAAPALQAASQVVPYVVPVGAADTMGANLLTKAATQGGINAGVAGVTNAASQATQGQPVDFRQVAGAGLTGGVLGFAAPVLGKVGSTLLGKADVVPPVAATAPEEIATGLKSVNPTQVEDALAQKAAAQVSTAPVAQPPEPLAPQSTTPTQPPVPPTTNSAEAVAPTPIQQPQLQSQSPVSVENPSLPETLPQTQPSVNSPTQTIAEMGGERQANDLQTQIEVAHNAGDTQRVSELIEQLPDDLKQPIRSALGLQEPAIAPVESAATVQALNAPNLRAQLTKQLGAAAQNVGDSTKHDVLSNVDLNTAASRVVENLAPEELLSKYSGVPELTNAADLAQANASLQKLAALTRDASPETAQAATKAIDNIMEGAEKGVSSGARTLNYAQSMYDTLPKEAQISLTIRTLDKARSAAGMPLIADDLPYRAQVESTLNNLLTRGEDIKEQLAAIEGQVQQIQDAVATHSASGDALKQLDALGQQQSDLTLQAQLQNGETARFYGSLVPGKAGLQKAADWAKTSMLTAPSGRLNNVFNVGGNSLYEVARSLPQSALGTVINAAKGSGTALDSSLLRPGALISGAKAGLQKTVAQIKGGATVNDLKGSLSKNNPEGGPFELTRTADNRGLNKVVNATQAAVRAPSEIIGGAVKQAQLERLARQEGEKAGFTGNDLKIYTKASSLVPTKQMAANAQLLQDQVSHMNKNPFADFAGKLFGDNNSKLTGNSRGVANLIKNTFLPFPKYASTFVWNTLTDRNIVADAVRATTSAVKGDINGLTRAIGGAVVDGTGMYLGYHLTQSGIITNKDAQGYSDGGAYLHLGNRYIPLGTLGVNAESLLAGNAMHNAVNGGGNPVEKFVKTVGDTVMNTVKTAGAQSIVGAGDQGLTAIQEALSGKNGVTAGDAASVVGGQAVGQFIPGLASDVNSVLNQTGLDPTHEAALTKVDKTSLTKSGRPSTAKNIPASELKSLASRVPFLSQTLPRKAGVASADFVDRVTRGSQETPSQVQAAQKTVTDAQHAADLKARDVPDPNATYASGDSFKQAVQNRIDKGQYDKAIAGLQEDLAKQRAGADPTKAALKATTDQIKTLQVLQAGKYDPSVVDLYKNTSLSEWRNMGDPKSDAYDPDKYALLWKYDNSLTSAKVSGNASDNTIGKYSPKAPPKGRSGSGSSKASGNTINSPTQLKDVSFGKLAPQKISVAIPQVGQLKPNELVKKRTISVGKAA